MYKLAIYLCILAVAAAVPLPAKQNDDSKEEVALLKFENKHERDGSFQFLFEGADGSFREEVGQLKNGGTDDEEIEVTGSYRYIDADGQLIEVTYTAGKNGFVPIGTNIPRAISEAARLQADTAAEEER